MRPAEFPAERENKVFIGMLSKELNEADLELLFACYGELKEVRSTITIRAQKEVIYILDTCCEGWEWLFKGLCIC